jgi:hypothetical protein
LGGLAIPPLLIMSRSSYYEFLPFLLLPLTFALLFTIVGFVFAALAFPWFRTSPSGKLLSPFLFNFLFLAVFLSAAEYHKNSLIAKALTNHKPDCILIHSFLNSLSHGGQEHQFPAHALFTEGGKVFFWSYSKLDFFEGRDGLNRNFPCHSPK